jgi:hypothetical protein
MTAHQRGVYFRFIRHEWSHPSNVKVRLVVSSQARLTSVFVLRHEYLTQAAHFDIWRGLAFRGLFDFWVALDYRPIFNEPFFDRLPSKKDAGTQHLKAVSAPLPIDNLCNAIECFCVPVADWVIEESQNLFSPVLGASQQRSEELLWRLGPPGWNRGSPSVKALCSIFLGQSIVNIEESLLKLVRLSNVGLVVKPYLNVKPALFIEVLVTHSQENAAPHPLCANPFFFGLCQPFAHVIQGGVSHSDNVELVNNDWQSGEYELGSVLVGAPHIHCQTLDYACALELMQPSDNGCLVSVRKHFDGDPVHNIGDDASQLAVNLGFVYSKPLGQSGDIGGIQQLDVVPRQVSDRLVIATNMFGNAQKRIAQALGSDVLGTPLSHARLRKDAAKGLNERPATVPALVALGVGQDANWTTSDWAISDMQRLRAMLVQVANGPALQARLGRDGVLGFNQVIISVKAFVDYVPAGEVKDVGHPAIVTDEIQESARLVFPSKRKPMRGSGQSYFQFLQCLDGENRLDTNLHLWLVFMDYGPWGTSQWRFVV